MATELDTVLISIRLRQDKIQRDLSRLDRRFKRTFRSVDKSVRKTRSGFEELASSIFTVRNVIAAIGTLGVFRGFRESIKAFTAFETGLVAIGKTTGIEGKRLENLGKQIEELSFKLPRTTKGLLEIGAAAGQMGIDTEEGIIAFTKTLGELELASDIIGEAGARSIARILTVTKTAITDVDKFGSVLVKLGNTAAATESEILEVAAKVGRAISAFDISPEFLLAIAASTKELAGTAEIAGTQIGLLFQKINIALNAGGQGLDDFAKIMNDSIESITKRFNEDAEPVIIEFIRRLNQLGKTGAAPALAALGLTGARINAVFGPLGNNIDIIAKNFFNAKEAWKENTELVREAIRAADTFSSRMQIIRNVLGAVARELSGNFLDSLGRFLGELSLKAANNIEAVAAAIRGLTVALGTLIALQFAGAIVTLLKLISPTKTALVLVSVGIAGLAGALATLSKRTIRVNGEITTLDGIFTAISKQSIPVFKEALEDLKTLFTDTFNIELTTALNGFLGLFGDFTIKVAAGVFAVIKSFDLLANVLFTLSSSFFIPTPLVIAQFKLLAEEIVSTAIDTEKEIRDSLGAIFLLSVAPPGKKKPPTFPELDPTGFTIFGSELDKIMRKTRLNIRVITRDTDDYSEVLLRLIDQFNLGPVAIASFAEQLKEVDDAIRQLDAIEKLQEDLDSFRSIFEDTFDSILDQAMEGKINMVEIFTSMVDEIIKEIIRLSVIEPILNSIFGNKDTGTLGILGGLFAPKKTQGEVQTGKDAEAIGAFIGRDFAEKFKQGETLSVNVMGIIDARIVEDLTRIKLPVSKLGIEETASEVDAFGRDLSLSSDRFNKLGAKTDDLSLSTKNASNAVGAFGAMLASVAGGGGSDFATGLAVASQAIGLAAGFAGGGGGGQGAADAQATGAFTGEMFNTGASSIPSLTSLKPPPVGGGPAGDQITIIIDARNSIGEEALSASIEGALARSLPGVVNAATNNIIIQRRRDPHIFEN